jgi:putative glycerol-1-phosphate prenyltransferase
MNPHLHATTQIDFLSSLNRGIALLIDPEKVESSDKLIQTLVLSVKCGVDLLFVGGSTVTREQLSATVNTIKQHCNLPVFLFPGSAQQISHEADALLYLSLISGRNPDYLIGHHVSSASELFHSSLEIIPTGYVLIDGGKMTSVAYVSQTTPIPQEQINIVRSTCMAGILLGQKLLYLDAGSGALQPVSKKMISEVSSLGVPLIVGGGIRSIDALHTAHDAGAKVVVIGNHVEENINFLLDIASYKRQYVGSQETRP